MKIVAFKIIVVKKIVVFQIIAYDGLYLWHREARGTNLIDRLQTSIVSIEKKQNESIAVIIAYISIRDFPLINSDIYILLYLLHARAKYT